MSHQRLVEDPQRLGGYGLGKGHEKALIALGIVLAVDFAEGIQLKDFFDRL
jgi:hypothetical protein